LAVTVSPVGTEIVPVAALPRVFTPVQYGSCPIVGAEDVESPLKPRVAPVRVMGNVVETVPCLLLKVLQSVEERHPAALPLETVQSIASAPPTA